MTTTADLEKYNEDLEAEGGPEKVIAGKSPTRIALQRLRSDKVAMISGLTVLLLILLGVLAPVITSLWGIYPTTNHPDAPLPSEVLSYDTFPAIGPPYYPFTWEHPLGLAPRTGVDNLARLLYGLRTSLAIATAATVLSTIIGVSIGLVAGFARGWLDRVISFTIDLFLSFPFILGALALAPIIVSRFSTDLDALSRAQVFALVTVLVVFGWMGLARLIRGQVLSLREREFVQAAQVMGVPTRRILFKELLPNLVAPIVVAISLSLPAYVAAEAGLSYLGIGLTGVPSLGQTINDAVNSFDKYPLYLWAPVITVMVLVLALNLLGDSIRDAFDPKTRR
ncbi:MAG TPA: ABC transporter permease [Nocardioidaceae bacterium]|nr:ABC transporter permease [Nocardioidaceae bacterium]